MQKRCLCRRFVRKFHNALFYVVCLAFHCWCQADVIIVSRFTVNGIATENPTTRTYIIEMWCLENNFREK